MSIVIIGTGMAGYSLAREIRKADAEVQLVMITADNGYSYPKPALSNALIQGKQPEQIISADAATMAERLNAVIHTHTKVTAVDSNAHSVETDTAGVISYDQLVLATGARPIRLPFKGNAADDLLSVNDIEEYTAFRASLEDAERIAIIGPGLIGCEFANDLAASGRSVTVIGPDPHPISTLLPEQAGKALQRGLSEIGIEWKLGTVAESINKADRGYELTLANGDKVQADVMLSAIGLKPELTLAEKIGLKTERGIVTDRFLATNQPDIYALGDCAEVEGKNLPYVMPLMIGARALAKTLTGTPTEVIYPVMPVVIKTPAHPIVVASAPREAKGEWEINATAKGTKCCFKSADGTVLGFALTGDAVEEKAALLKVM
ncbi:MAG: FAD-dependent oxidoreductase [Sedimenticola sp.]|nr:FAD-dependent oxidoreductase [Sedimenticola sp.]